MAPTSRVKTVRFTDPVGHFPLFVLIVGFLVFSCAENKGEETSREEVCTNVRTTFLGELRPDTTIQVFIKSVSEIANETSSNTLEQKVPGPSVMERRSRVARCLVLAHPAVDSASATSSGHAVRVHDSTQNRWFNILIEPPE